MIQTSDLITDEQAMEQFKDDRITALYGVKVGPEWVGPGALDEFSNGKGDDSDDRK